MNLYTIVTNDKYKFPVKSDVTFGEVVEFLGMSKTNVKNMIYKPRKKAKYKILITGKTKFDQNAYSKKYLLTHDRSEYFKKYYRDRVEKAKADLEEIQQYRDLGTVEELRALKEKQISKKPIFDGLYCCPACKQAMLQGTMESKGNCCKKCGQALDWS